MNEEPKCSFTTYVDLSFLSDKEKKIFLLRHRLGRSDASIGHTCGISPRIVNKVLLEAEEKIRTFLSPMGRDPPCIGNISKPENP